MPPSQHRPMPAPNRKPVLRRPPTKVRSRRPPSLRTLLLLTAAALLLPACQSAPPPAPPGPDYGRPLSPGAPALRKVDPADWPALPDHAPPDFLTALRRSADWYTKPSTQQFFPIADVTHDQAHASTRAMLNLLESTGGSIGGIEQQLREQFDLYMSVGWDGSGEVLFTGYYSPVFRARLEPTGEFQYPLYKRPPDLVTDPATGRVLGQRFPTTDENIDATRDKLAPYPTRRTLETTDRLRGLELVYLPSRLDAYFIEVNGSAKLILPGGETMYVGYAGTNGHNYTSIGKLLVEDGKLRRGEVSIQGIRRYFRLNPTELDYYIQRNDRFVFFQEYGPEVWPAGALGFRVTAYHSLATDKSLFPRGMPMLVDTSIPTRGGGTERFKQFMLDQDAGGAIRAPGRADIYMGQGSVAEAVAGRQAYTGRMYYFVLKPRYVSQWIGQ